MGMSSVRLLLRKPLDQTFVVQKLGDEGEYAPLLEGRESMYVYWYAFWAQIQLCFFAPLVCTNILCMFMFLEGAVFLGVQPKVFPYLEKNRVGGWSSLLFFSISPFVF